MSSATTGNQVALLKRLYPRGVAEALYKRSVLLADAKKSTDFGGEGVYVNIRINGTAGSSSDFGTALANMRATTEKRFFVTHRKEYSLFSVQGDAIARSKGDKNAIVSVLKTQVDGAKYAFERAMAARVYGDQGGAIGRISASSNVATTAVTLATPSHISRFEEGIALQTSVDNGSGTSPAGTNGGPAQLTAVGLDRGTGGITANANWNTLPGTAVNHFIFRAGDYANAMTGIAGWIPSSAPSGGESFFGMDRSVGDVVRQSGIRHVGGGGSKEETLVNAGIKAAVLGSQLKRCYVSPFDFGDLQKELGSKVVIDVKTREPDVGFKGIDVHTPAGTVTVVSDTDCPQGTAYMINPDDIELATAGECPSMLNWDGVGQVLRAANDDALQGRLGAYGNFKFAFNNVPVNITW